MPLRETASTIQPKRTGFPCGVTKLAGRLSEDDREWLQEQIANAEVSSAWISKVLLEEGHDLSQNVISRHKRKQCRCES